MQNQNSFEAIIRQVIREELNDALNRTALIQPAPTQPDQIFINEVEEITGYARQTVYVKVSRDEIPVLAYGRPLIFSKTHINKWLEAGRPKNWRDYV